MDAPLLGTKLYAPRPAGHLVHRARLIDRLRAAAGGQLVLVSAPAGYGKSALVAEWLRAEGRPAAWVSLDTEDSDPRRFWAYVAAALGGLDPRLGESLAPALHPAEDGAAPEALLGGLVNALLRAPAPLALVLDDYHLIAGAAVHRGVEFLSSHLPPTLTLVIAGRADPPWPLARRRARGELVEVRAADLRFTREEAAAFLNDGMALGLSPQEVEVLSERTEGWIVGLQMAALSLRGHDDVSAYLQALSASDRYILDYLLEEVLERQPPAVYEFLLATAILRRLSAPLCAAVTGREDAAAILAHLEAANLFLVALDGARHWYRYHHLFADLLGDLARARAPERLPEWHARASAWWEAEGPAEEAIHHALEGGDPQRAARLVRAHALGHLARGEARTVGDWFSRLPAEVVRGDGLLALERAWLCGPREDCEEWIRSVLEGADEEAPPPGLPYPTFRAFAEASIGVLRAERARLRSEPLEAVLPAARAAYERVPAADGLLKARAAHVVGRTFLQYERVEEAEGWFALARQGAPGEDALARLATLGIEAQQMWHDGRLRGLAALCERALAEYVRPAEAAGRPLAHACQPYVLLGRVRWQRNDLSEAERLLTRGLALAERARDLNAARDARRTLAMLRCAQGRFDEALALLDEIERAASAWPSPAEAAAFVQCFRVRVWVWRARVEGDAAPLTRAAALGRRGGARLPRTLLVRPQAWPGCASPSGAPPGHRTSTLVGLLRENLACPARPRRRVPRRGPRPRGAGAAAEGAGGGARRAGPGARVRGARGVPAPPPGSRRAPGRPPGAGTGARRAAPLRRGRRRRPVPDGRPACPGGGPPARRARPGAAGARRAAHRARDGDPPLPERSPLEHRDRRRALPLAEHGAVPHQAPVREARRPLAPRGRRAGAGRRPSVGGRQRGAVSPPPPPPPPSAPRTHPGWVGARRFANHPVNHPV